MIIEFDDTAVAANHIHVVIRDLASDFGRDALRKHRAEHHQATYPRDEHGVWHTPPYH